MAEYVGEPSVAAKQADEGEQEDIPSPSTIKIEEESMNVEGTKITLDTNDNVFKNLENIVDNSALDELDRTTEAEQT